jgi:AraC family transcriptional activator of pobA
MTAAASIPVFNLYGEATPWPTPDLVHCESIASRSELHNWQIRAHRHNGLFQILYLTGGRASIQLEDQTVDMTPGQILLIPQMCVHGFQFEQTALGHVVTMTYPLIHKLTRQAGDGLLALTMPSIHRLAGDTRSRHIKAAFAALRDEYQGSAAYRHLVIESLLSTILIWLAGQPAQYQFGPEREPDSGRAAQHFSLFGDLIEKHYSEHQAQSWYAARLGITAAHLNALCRARVGKSALELVHARILLEAKRNLVYTSMSVSVVAYTVGFADPAYFTRFFKRAVGLSPKEFRKQVGTQGD